MRFRKGSFFILKRMITASENTPTMHVNVMNTILVDLAPRIASPERLA